MRTSIRRHGRRNLPAAGRVSDAKQVATAASLQRACGSWLVMWSRWHRTYTAFACFTAGPVIVDEAMVEAFLARIKQIELASASGRDVRR